MPRIDKLWWELDAQTGDLSKGLTAASPTMSRFSALMRNGPVAAVAALGVVATVVGAKTVQAFAKFDDAMTKSLAIMGNVSDALRRDMAQAARQVAQETSFSAEEAAKAYFYLASAGLSAAESLQAMPVVARFAQAGMFDLALATDLVTDAQSALGLKTGDLQRDLENMTRISDVLVKANVLANATVQQFSEAITNQAGPAIKAANKDIEEGVAVLAAFADQGIKGAEAGTRLNILFRDLQTKALSNANEFRRLGVQVFDANGKLLHTADTIASLERALDGLSDAQRKATLLQLGFSDRSVIAIQSILGSSDAIREYDAALRAAGGTTKEIAEKNLDSLKEQFGLLGSAVAETALKIGSELAPAVTTLVEALRGLFDTLNGNIELIRDLQPATSTLITTLQQFRHGALLSEEGWTRMRAALTELLDATAEGKAGDFLAGLTQEQLKAIQAFLREQPRDLDRLLGPVDLAAQASFERAGTREGGFDALGKRRRQLEQLEQLEREVSQRIVAAKDEANADSEEDAADSAQRIALEDLRVLVEIGERRKQELLGRLREEVQLLEEGSEEKRNMLLEIHQLEKAIADEQKERAELIAEATAAAQQKIVESTETMVDDMELALQQFGDKWREDWDKLPAQVRSQLEAAMTAWRDMIETVRFIEPIEQQLDDLEERMVEVFRVPVPEPAEVEGLLSVLGRMGADINEQLRDATKTEASRKKLEALLKRIEELERQIAGHVRSTAEDTDELTKKNEERLRQLRQTVSEIERAASAAVKFASAMGLVDDATARALDNLVDIGGGIGQIFAGNPIGGAIQVLGGLAGLFGGGPSPEELRRREAIKENTEAIKELTRNVGDFGLDITGAEFATVQRTISNAFARFPDRSGPFGAMPDPRLVPSVLSSLDALGISMAELRDIAGQLGITFAEATPNAKELQQLFEAMAAAELTRFAQTFEGQLAALQARFELFDIEDPLQQLREFGRVAGNQGGALREVLWGVDLNSAEGRAVVERRLQALFNQLQAGTLTLDQLGGLTPQQFLDALLQMEGLLDEIAANTEEATEEVQQATQFTVDRSITEITGTRIASILESGLLYQSITAANTARIVELMGGTPIEGPPFLGTSGGFGIGGSAVFNITVQVTGAVGEDDLPELGAAIGAAVARGIDDALGLRATQVLRAAGAEV